MVFLKYLKYYLLYLLRILYACIRMRFNLYYSYTFACHSNTYILHRYYKILRFSIKIQHHYIHKKLFRRHDLNMMAYQWNFPVNLLNVKHVFNRNDIEIL